MDFLSIVLFLVIYYIRPQEWIGFLNRFHPVDLIMIFALVAMMTRHRGLKLKDFFQTPHDWAMFAYFAWMIGKSPAPFSTFQDVQNFIIFYLVIVQALSTMGRVRNYLTWWTVMIFFIAAMALASEFGFDPMGSYDLTHGPMKDRLSLNTSIFNNPNALGHSVVPVIPLVYFLLFWKRPIFIKELAVPFILLPVWCVYLTVSKGAFLAGFVTLVAAMVIGRPKFLQVIFIALALLFGKEAMDRLPRMQEISHARDDPAIMGRLTAFRFGMKKMEENPAGIGWNNFNQSFRQEHQYIKAAHSSYVQIGAELGYTGLWLYVGIIYCCLRTLLTVKTSTPDEERIRRMLFVLLVSYAISSWMIDFGHRATFFILAASVAGFHRQLVAHSQAPARLEMEPVAVPQWIPATIGGRLPPTQAIPAFQSSMAGQLLFARAATGSASVAQDKGDAPWVSMSWNRIGLIDLALIWLMTQVTVRFWAYIIENL